MKDFIKTPEEIEGIRAACRIASDTLTMVFDHVVPGVTTQELNDICHKYIEDNGAYPTSLGYEGFPKAICSSVNHVICHGIPSDKKLKNGDILNIDIGVTKDGYIGDTSRMYFVGKKRKVQAERLVSFTYYAMMAGIGAIQPGNDVSEIGNAIERFRKMGGMPFSIVRDYCGHGVGIEYHEPPQVLHYAHGPIGFELKPGMVLTVEPMINAGKPDTKRLPDNWTVVTKDHSLSAQWEHTILVTEDGHEILTQA